MRSLPAWALLACLMLSGPVPGQTPAPQAPPLDISLQPGSLQQALDRLAHQTGLQILYDAGLVQGRFANQVQGRMTATQALERLLAPTDVTFQVTGPDSVALLPAPPAPLSEVRVVADAPRFVAPTERDRIGRIWAPVTINGKGPFRLVLDTGASRSALVARTARQLGISANRVPARLYGVTGTALVPTVSVDTMEVGNVPIESTSLPIVADVFGGAEGVLGRDGLEDKRIVADFKHDRLVIARSRGERAPAGYSVVHLTLTRMGLLAASIRVGGVPATAIIDTGAQATIGNIALRDALLRRRPPQALNASIVGVTLDVQRGDGISAPPLLLGRMQVNGARVIYGDMSLFEHWHLTQEPTLLLGMDVLGAVDELVIDYKLCQLQIRMREGDFPVPITGVPVKTSTYSDF